MSEKSNDSQKTQRRIDKHDFYVNVDDINETDSKITMSSMAHLDY